MDDAELVLIATALSVLGYNIGAMIMMLPIPFTGLKKWAPTLMKDSIFSLILIFSVYSIIEVVGYFQRLLGVSWNSFSDWLIIRTGTLMALKTTLTGIVLISSKFLSGLVAAAVFEPVLKAINYSLTVLYTILGIGMLIRDYFVKILIIGIVLFSIPFRFARGAGSYLIAFAIVFSIGLPLMPEFVETFSNSVDISAYTYQADSIDFAVFHVKNMLGHSVYKPLIKAYDSNGKLLFLYKGNADGNIFASFPDKPIPINFSYTLVLDYLGIIFYLEPYPFNPKRDLIITEKFFPYAGKQASLVASHLIWSHPSAFALVGISNTSVVSKIKYTNNGASVYIDLSNIKQAEKLYISFDKECTSKIGTTSGNITAKTIDSKWFNINIRTIVFELNFSNEIIRIDAYFEKCQVKPTNIEVSEIKYLEDAGFSLFKDFTKEASSIIISWLILPTIYLFILLSITLGVSYVIGGLREKIPIRFL